MQEAEIGISVDHFDGERIDIGEGFLGGRGRGGAGLEIPEDSGRKEGDGEDVQSPENPKAEDPSGFEVGAHKKSHDTEDEHQQRDTDDGEDIDYAQGIAYRAGGKNKGQERRSDESSGDESDPGDAEGDDEGESDSESDRFYGLSEEIEYREENGADEAQHFLDGIPDGADTG